MKKNWKKLVIATLCAIMVVAFFATSVSAKPKNGRWIDPKTGHVYIMKNGKPSSYPKGSCTTDALRIRHGKMYYFKSNGQKQTKSSRYIKLNRHSTSVKYLTAGRMSRYNANRRCYQWLNPNSGRWEDTGMACYPYGSIDWQK